MLESQPIKMGGKAVQFLRRTDCGTIMSALFVVILLIGCAPQGQFVPRNAARSIDSSGQIREPLDAFTIVLSDGRVLKPRHITTVEHSARPDLVVPIIPCGVGGCGVPTDPTDPCADCDWDPYLTNGILQDISTVTNPSSLCALSYLDGYALSYDSVKQNCYSPELQVAVGTDYWVYGQCAKGAATYSYTTAINGVPGQAGYELFQCPVPGKIGYAQATAVFSFTNGVTAGDYPPIKYSIGGVASYSVISPKYFYTNLNVCFYFLNNNPETDPCINGGGKSLGLPFMPDS